jgi:dienelactone hydrolase
LRERPLLAAFGPNRYPPYAEAAGRAKKQVYVFHPSEPRARADQVLPDLKRRPGRVEVVVVAGFTVILYEEP